MSIQAVFFDFIGTLARLVPEQEALLARAAALHGVLLTPAAARRGLTVAGAWWQQQMARHPLERRSEAERHALHTAFDELVLREAGYELEPGHAGAIFTSLLELGSISRLEVYDDVPPALVAMGAAGLTLGVISNMDASLRNTLDALDLLALFAVVVCSEEAGSAKPDPAIFHHALRQAGAAAAPTVYVGDTPEIDVTGALAAGLLPVLIDRLDALPDPPGGRRIRSMADLPALVRGLSG